MNFTIEIDKQLKIIRYKHSGDIKKDDIGEAWNNFLGMIEFTEQKYNLLSDYRDSVFIANQSDIDIICTFLSNIKNIIDGKKQAIIVDNPSNTALSYIFEDQIYKQTNFIVKIFSTEEAAINWLIKK